jgi:hypothetical protein
MYTNSTDDAAYKRDTLDWLKRFYTGLREIKPKALLLIPNHPSHIGSPIPGFWGSDAWNSTEIFWVGNYSDGILSEEGFTGYGGGLVSDSQWLNKILFMRNLDRNGKAYFSVDYWGPNNTQHMKQPEAVTRAVVDYAVASYLVGKGSATALFLGPNECSYGPPCTCGDWCSKDVLDYSPMPSVGKPIASEPQEVDGGVWTREFSCGFALVNPSSHTGATYKLDSAFEWRDRLGNLVSPPSNVLPLPAKSAAVLTKHARKIANVNILQASQNNKEDSREASTVV